MSKPKAKELTSNLHVKLTVKSQGFEIETEGTIADLSKELPSLSSFVSAISTATGAQLEEEIPGAGEEMTPSEVPAVKVTSSNIENIRNLFNTPWGRKPRSPSDVGAALETNGAPDTTAAVNRDLTRLLQRGFLRRIPKGSTWSYYHVPES